MDSRDLIEERDNLKAELLESFNEQFPESKVDEFEDIRLADITDAEEYESWEKYNEDDIFRIKAIDNLEDEVSSNEWNYGITFIPEDEFEDYCKELCEDCGYISKDFPHWITIDWSDTADNMLQDYNEVEFDGETYLYRP